LSFACGMTAAKYSFLLKKSTASLIASLTTGRVIVDSDFVAVSASKSNEEPFSSFCAPRRGASPRLRSSGNFSC
jgi:hypothetical protein